jgi:hypothetical protein
LSLILREEYKLRLFEDRLLSRIFGSDRDDVMGSWRKLHKEELHDLCSAPSIIRIIKSRRLRWVGYVEGMGEKSNVYRLFVGKRRRKENTRKTKMVVCG